MRPVMASMACAVLFSALVFAEDVPAPKTTDSWYLWSTQGQRDEAKGYLHIRRGSVDEKLAPVRLEIDFRIMSKGKSLRLLLQEWCKDDAWLSPVKIVSQGEGDDEFGTFTATVSRMAGTTAGKLSAVLKGRKVEIEVPEHTATFFGLFEVVRTLPFDKDKVFECAVLESEELNLKKDRKIVYLGEEELDVAGELMRLHKFEHTGAGRVVACYWLNDKHELLRVLIDGRKELVLTTREKAEAALAAPKGE